MSSSFLYHLLLAAHDWAWIWQVTMIKIPNSIPICSTTQPYHKGGAIWSFPIAHYKEQMDQCLTPQCFVWEVAYQTPLNLNSKQTGHQTSAWHIFFPFEVIYFPTDIQHRHIFNMKLLLNMNHKWIHLWLQYALPTTTTVICNNQILVIGNDFSALLLKFYFYRENTLPLDKQALAEM